MPASEDFRQYPNRSLDGVLEETIGAVDALAEHTGHNQYTEDSMSMNDAEPVGIAPTN